MSISNQNIRIQVTIPKNIKNQLEIKAENNNRSVSNYVASLILKDLSKEPSQKD